MSLAPSSTRRPVWALGRPGAAPSPEAEAGLGLQTSAVARRQLVWPQAVCSEGRGPSHAAQEAPAQSDLGGVSPPPAGGGMDAGSSVCGAGGQQSPARRPCAETLGSSVLSGAEAVPSARPPRALCSSDGVSFPPASSALTSPPSAAEDGGDPELCSPRRGGGGQQAGVARSWWPGVRCAGAAAPGPVVPPGHAAGAEGGASV